MANDEVWTNYRNTHKAYNLLMDRLWICYKIISFYSANLSVRAEMIRERYVDLFRMQQEPWLFNSIVIYAGATKLFTN